ncbi:Gfo/Idh/MocA family oxidoreductase, partial [Candidatus Woesearchaeota archaeon]|nr:Gfo/Idh/MocA family oxidoreductase [Candidatus Woesearchaeota archaeon]
NKDFSLYAIVTKNGHNAKKLTEEYNAKLASTSYRDIINNKNVDLVIIGTRHDSHAKIAIEALRKNKHVYCEKPMAINEKEFKVLENEIKKSKKTYTCGFNRRYSLVFQKIKSKIDNKKPMIINYIFNNIYLPKDHWVNIPEIGGGRIIGEACHIIDLFNYLTDSVPISVKSQQISSSGNQKSNDDNNIITAIKYKDGSICNLTYSCIGNANVERERCIIIQDGNVIEMNGFGKAQINNKNLYKGKTDEGYESEISELGKKLTEKDSLTITSDICINTTKTVFNIINNVK